MAVIGRRAPQTFDPPEPTPEQKQAFVRSVLGPFEDVGALERAITDIAAGMRVLTQSRLKRDTIVLLLHDATKLGKRDIGFVLNALEQIETTYLKPIKTKP